VLAITDEGKLLRQEARTLKEVVAEQALELRLHGERIKRRTIQQRRLMHQRQAAELH
jgi:hypothetical protein